MPDFSSTLTLSVPSSTPTSAYSVTITASSGGTSLSTSYTISVLSAQVYVLGNVQTIGKGTNPTENRVYTHKIKYLFLYGKK
jgi:hypothetical protein